MTATYTLGDESVHRTLPYKTVGDLYAAAAASATTSTTTTASSPGQRTIKKLKTITIVVRSSCLVLPFYC